MEKDHAFDKMIAEISGQAISSAIDILCSRLKEYGYELGTMDFKQAWCSSAYTLLVEIGTRLLSYYHAEDWKTILSEIQKDTLSWLLLEALNDGDNTQLYNSIGEVMDNNEGTGDSGR